jgi:hypothetical protein
MSFPLDRRAFNTLRFFLDPWYRLSDPTAAPPNPLQFPGENHLWVVPLLERRRHLRGRQPRGKGDDPPTRLPHETRVGGGKHAHRVGVPESQRRSVAAQVAVRSRTTEKHRGRRRRQTQKSTHPYRVIAPAEFRARTRHLATHQLGLALQSFVVGARYARSIANIPRRLAARRARLRRPRPDASKQFVFGFGKRASS